MSLTPTLFDKLIDKYGFEKLKSYYNDNFPLEVRFVCARWIENRLLNDEFIDNDIGFPMRATNFMQSLIEQLEMEVLKFYRPEELSIKFRLNEAIQIFKQNMYNAIPPYKQIRDAIIYEKYLHENCDSIDSTTVNSIIDEEAENLNKQLKELRQIVFTNNEQFNQFQNSIEQFYLNFGDYNRSVQSINAKSNLSAEQKLIDIANFNHQMHNLRNCINNKRDELHQNIQNVIITLNEVQKIIIYNRLYNWQKQQLKPYNKKIPINTLDEIQLWFEELANLIWSTRTLIDRIRKVTQSNEFEIPGQFDTMYEQISFTLKNLIVAGFVIVQQPARVLRTNQKFSATVRMLTANLSIHLNNPVVSVSILNDVQAAVQQENHMEIPPSNSGTILNCKGNLEYTQGTKHLVCNLRNMQIKTIVRAERKGSECVLDEKFALLFQSTFQCGDMLLQVWVMSVPVVVSVHASQFTQAMATIVWDNVFAEEKRNPFKASDSLPWSTLAKILNDKFKYETGKALTTDILKYLYSKVLRLNASSNVPYDEQRMVTWNQFCKDPLPSCTFTFWVWFYEAIKLTKNHLREAWNDGYILGFVNRQEAEDVLKKCAPGTFLLRFSDSQLGGITLAWVVYNIEPQVLWLRPFTHVDFQIRNLSATMKDIHQCTILYPNISKEVAFTYSEIRKKPVGKNTGYIERHLSTTIAVDNMMTTSNMDPQFNIPSVDSTNSASPEHNMFTYNESNVDFQCSEFQDLVDELHEDHIMQVL